jgi:hypothetical protein
MTAHLCKLWVHVIVALVTNAGTAVSAMDAAHGDVLRAGDSGLFELHVDLLTGRTHQVREMRILFMAAK